MPISKDVDDRKGLLNRKDLEVEIGNRDESGMNHKIQ